MSEWMMNQTRGWMTISLLHQCQDENSISTEKNAYEAPISLSNFHNLRINTQNLET